MIRPNTPFFQNKLLQDQLLKIAPRVPRPATNIASRLLTNYTFVLWRISVISNHSLLQKIAKELGIWANSHFISLISFLLFSLFTFISPIQPNSHQTIISKFSNFSFQTFSCLIFSNVEGFVASSVSSKLLDCFQCAKKAAYHEVASLIRYKYKRKVYYERTP